MGAPIGNKNAAGPHGGGGFKKNSNAAVIASKSKGGLQIDDKNVHKAFGSGHTGDHNPATSTGNAVVDAATAESMQRRATSDRIARGDYTRAERQQVFGK